MPQDVIGHPIDLEEPSTSEARAGSLFKKIP